MGRRWGRAPSNMQKPGGPLDRCRKDPESYGEVPVFFAFWKTKKVGGTPKSPFMLHASSPVGQDGWLRHCSACRQNLQSGYLELVGVLWSKCACLLPASSLVARELHLQGSRFSSATLLLCIVELFSFSAQ